MVLESATWTTAAPPSRAATSKGHLWNIGTCDPWVAA
jgi:hypothetical protein